MIQFIRSFRGERNLPTVKKGLNATLTPVSKSTRIRLILSETLLI